MIGANGGVIIRTVVQPETFKSRLQAHPDLSVK